MWWPPHEGGLIVWHNEHKSVYERIEDYADEERQADSWISPEEKAKAIAEDSVWEVQWYPVTPVGFYHVSASTLEACIEHIKTTYEGGGYR